jgi:hypothetical protein
MNDDLGINYEISNKGSLLHGFTLLLTHEWHRTWSKLVLILLQNIANVVIMIWKFLFNFVD